MFRDAPGRHFSHCVVGTQKVNSHFGDRMQTAFLRGSGASAPLTFRKHSHLRERGRSTPRPQFQLKLRGSSGAADKPALGRLMNSSKNIASHSPGSIL